jgi:hypothetical protein
LGDCIFIFQICIVLDLWTAEEVALLVNGCLLLCCRRVRQDQVGLGSSKTDTDKGLCFGWCNGSDFGCLILGRRCCVIDDVVVVNFG